MRLILPLLLVIGLCVGLLHAQPRFSGKWAILDEGSEWATQEGTDRTLRRIRDAGFNVYVPCVWHGRGTKWPSRLAPWDPDLRNQPKEGYDPIRYLIRKAHEMGIEVYPWFTVVLRQSDLFTELAEPGTPKDAFDVHDARFHRLMTDLIAEVVTRYDVDGINLDYVRTMGLCSNPSCQQAYKQKYGRNLTLDSISFKLAPGKIPTLIEFQEEAVTTLVHQISNRVRRIKPDISITVDAIPGVAGPDQGQDSVGWLNRGLIDVLFRMDYYLNINTQLTDSLRSQLKNPDGLTVLISNVSQEETATGQKHFPRDAKWLAGTVSTIQERWPHTGIGVYFYKALSDEQIAALRQGPFQNQSSDLGGRGDKGAVVTSPGMGE